MEEHQPVVFSYEKYRQEYLALRGDTIGLANWVRGLRREGLSEKIIAHITGLAPNTVAHLVKGRFNKVQTLTVYAPVAIVPENWCNRDWLSRMHDGHTVSQLSIILKLPSKRLIKILRGFGIKPRKHPGSVHPYCTKEWLIEQMAAGLGVTAMAAKAKVSSYTINKWLYRHKIREEPEWIAVISSVLKLFPIVWTASYRSKSDDLAVRFKDSSVEYLGIRPKSEVDEADRPRYTQFVPQKLEVRYQPVITPQYEDHFSTLYNPIAISRIPAKANELEKLIARHIFLKAYYDNASCDGFVRHPRSVLEHSKNRLLTLAATTKLSYRQGKLYTGFLESACWRVLEYYIDFFALGGSHCSPDMAAIACRKIPVEKLNTTRFIRKLTASLTAWINPIFLATVFKELGIKGRVLDLWPQNGTKALACWLAGLEYCTPPSNVIDRAAERGFFEFLGLKYSTYDGEQVDLVLADKLGKHGYTDFHMRHMDKGRHTMIVCGADEVAKMQDKYTVKRVIPIDRSPLKTTETIQNAVLLIL